MVLTTLGTGNQQTRDELGSEPSIQTIYKIKNEKVIVEEGPMQITQQTIGHSFILSHGVNGILGSPYNGVDGQQVLLGEHNRVTSDRQVINQKKIYRERFNFDNFKDSFATNADWNTDAGTARLILTTAAGTAQSLPFALDDGRIIKATMDYDLISGTTTTISLAMSAAGSANFESVTKNTEHTFSTSGTTGVWRVTSTGTAEVDNIIINYG